MTILLTNDDGVEAPGLYALAETLLSFDDVFIAAPATEQSGVGHAITIRHPIAVDLLDERPLGVPRLAVRGTPADAVKFALRHHLPEKPALVVSGPNTGPNVGVNVFYSGTLGAAGEGVMAGISALAVSSECQVGPWDWTACCHFTRQVLQKALPWEADRRKHPEAHLRHGDARPFLLNLNVPARPLSAIHGLAVTHHGTSGFEEFFVPQAQGSNHFAIEGDFQANDEHDRCDATMLIAGYASLTPLALDLTDVGRLRRLEEFFRPEE